MASTQSCKLASLCPEHESTSLAALRFRTKITWSHKLQTDRLVVSEVYSIQQQYRTTSDKDKYLRGKFFHAPSLKNLEKNKNMALVFPAASGKLHPFILDFLYYF